ncbi:efflux RND transporter periplasmic adaptor subunit [Vibrio astriarenae]
MRDTIQHSLLLGCCIALAGCQQASESAETNTDFKKPVHVVAVEQAVISNQKTFHGTVQSQEKAGLAFRIPGTLEEVLVKKGQRVKKGDVIARLDQHDYTVALEELEARKLEAVSAHKLAKAELARVEQALEDNAIASVNRDRAISGYERSLSAIKVVDKNIQRAKDTLSYTEIKAPFDSVVAQVNFDAYEQVLPGIAVVTLQNNQLLEVDIDVPDTLIGQFELGQQGNVSWYQSNEKLLATLNEISTQPDPIRQTYSLTFAIDAPQSELLPGRAVTLSTDISHDDAGYCLPYSSLVGEKEDMFVNLVRDEHIVTQRIEVMNLNSRYACLNSDFESNDYVVISGSHYLQQGDHVANLIVKAIEE